MIKKIAGWTALAFLAWVVVKNPAGAAHTTKAIGAGLSHVATGFSAFLTHVTT